MFTFLLEESYKTMAICFHLLKCQGTVFVENDIFLFPLHTQGYSVGEG